MHVEPKVAAIVDLQLLGNIDCFGNIFSPKKISSFDNELKALRLEDMNYVFHTLSSATTGEGSLCGIVRGQRDTILILGCAC